MSGDCSKMLTGQSCTQKCADGYASGSEVLTTYTCPNGIFVGTPLKCRLGEPAVREGSEAVKSDATSMEAASKVEGSASATTVMLIVAAVVLFVIGAIVFARRTNSSDDDPRNRGETMEMMDNPMQNVKKAQQSAPAAINPHFQAGEDGPDGVTMEMMDNSDADTVRYSGYEPPDMSMSPSSTASGAVHVVVGAPPAHGGAASSNIVYAVPFEDGRLVVPCVPNVMYEPAANNAYDAGVRSNTTATTTGNGGGGGDYYDADPVPGDGYNGYDSDDDDAGTAA